MKSKRLRRGKKTFDSFFYITRHLILWLKTTWSNHRSLFTLITCVKPTILSQGSIQSLSTRCPRHKGCRSYVIVNRENCFTNEPKLFVHEKKKKNGHMWTQLIHTQRLLYTCFFLLNWKEKWHLSLQNHFSWAFRIWAFRPCSFRCKLAYADLLWERNTVHSLKSTAKVVQVNRWW